jgi:hypothetical protein
MYQENKSYKLDAYRTCLSLRTLGTTRGSGRKSVPLHRASRHAWIDIILEEETWTIFASGIGLHVSSYRADLVSFYLHKTFH